MNGSRMIDWQYVVGLLLLPLLILGVALLAGWIAGQTRYEPAYFDEEYISLYAVPSQLLVDLENAIRNGDPDLFAVVQGTSRAPTDQEALPSVRFMILWEVGEKYTDYLFMDTSNYHRYMQHLKVVNGRYVQVPEGFYYYMDSGRWISIIGPLTAVWWMLVILFTLGIWIYRSMAAAQQRMYKSRPPDP